MSRRHILAGIVALLAAFPAVAQTFPAKPVRMVVPFAAGGPTDVMTRTFANGFSAQLNQQVLVENRPGAGGNIAAAHVATSPADGYTLLVAGQGILAINKALYGRINYEPEKDFAWIGMLGSLPNVLVVTPDLPAQNMQQFIELARSQPEKISYGSNGIGSLSHLTTEVLASAAGVKFLHVPYQGAAPQRTDLLSGRIRFSFIAASTMLPLIREGKLRALAVSTNTRLASLPGIPTLVESGYPMLDAPTWFAAVAPSATPAPVLAALRAAFAAAIAAPAYGPEMEKQSSIVVKMGPEAAEAMLARERKTWSDAVRSTGAKAE